LSKKPSPQKVKNPTHPVIKTQKRLKNDSTRLFQLSSPKATEVAKTVATVIATSKIQSLEKAYARKIEENEIWKKEISKN